MCTHASASRAALIASAKGSKAPEWMSPAWRITIVGRCPCGGQGAAQGLGLDASLIVRLHQFGLAEPQVAQRQVDGHVAVLMRR